MWRKLLFLTPIVVAGMAHASAPFTWTLVSSSVSDGANTEVAPSESPTHEWTNLADTSWNIAYSVSHKTTVTVSGSSSTGPTWSSSFTPLGDTIATNGYSGSIAIPPDSKFTADVLEATRTGGETWTNGTDNLNRACSGKAYKGPKAYTTFLGGNGGGGG